MEDMQGAMGTKWSLALRMGQAISSVSSLLFMCLGVDFYGYTAFCFLVAIMGVVIPWSLILSLLDMLSVSFKTQVRPPGILSIVLVGDWVLSLLSLAASCSTGSMTDFLLSSNDSFCLGNMCTRYQLSAAMAFMAWFLLLYSFLLNLWFLASL